MVDVDVVDVACPVSLHVAGRVAGDQHLLAALSSKL